MPTPPTPIEPPNGIFDQTKVATYVVQMYAYSGVPCSAAVVAHYQALYAQCLEAHAGAAYNAAADDSALYDLCDASLQNAVVSDLAAYRKAHPPPSPQKKAKPMTPPSAQRLSAPLASTRRARGVYGMVGGMRALRTGRVGDDPSAAVPGQPVQPLLGANITPAAQLFPFVPNAGNVLFPFQPAAPGAVLAPAPSAAAPAASPYTTPILAGALALALGAIVYAYDKPSGRAHA